MTDLFWPGDERAGDVFSDAAFLRALVDVENAWLAVLVEDGVAPLEARTNLTALISSDDVAVLAAGAERDGNPVTGLVALLRERAAASPARWLHRGLTSQDVVDTALMLCLRSALARVEVEIAEQVRMLTGLAETHQNDPMLTRTLTQPALPGTVGLKAAVWLSAVLDAGDAVAVLPALPVQAGGAAGTLAATTELTGSPDAAMALAGMLADALVLAPATPWHTTRSVITRAGDALVGSCDAWGRIANDVAIGSRHEIGEWREGSGGGSSTMPHKNNPVLTVLIRRAALTAPQLGATLHSASAAAVDERADGGWHTEWATLRTLARRTVVAAAQTSYLLAGLTVDTERAAGNLTDADGILAEQQTMTELNGSAALPSYTGAAAQIVDATLQRARHFLKETT